ncbi:hypothetical protein [Halobellus sp.]
MDRRRQVLLAEARVRGVDVDAEVDRVAEVEFRSGRLRLRRRDNERGRSA